eukprot:Skav225989  [mRNA]  locus=scaffold4003:117202:122354:- [translate_table: standard]
MRASFLPARRASVLSPHILSFTRPEALRDADQRGHRRPFNFRSFFCSSALGACSASCGRFSGMPRLKVTVISLT